METEIKKEPMEIEVTIQLKSPLQLSSGAADVNVDTDVILDEWGLPFIPAKRFRGALYESALEIVELKECLNETNGPLNRTILEEVFNRGNEESEVRTSFEDFRIKGYQQVIKDLEVLSHMYRDVVGYNRIRNAFTSLRYQTAIDEKKGIAKDGSLRNMRVVDNTSFVFEGTIRIEQGTADHQMLLAVALENLTAIGFKRNRGFGRIDCSMEEQKELVEDALDGSRR